MSEGTLTGDGINARIAMPGGDWYSPGADGFGRPRATRHPTTMR
jgi:hypothetical protein